ncbi:hypothetical protein HMPREF1991_00301 [Hoylesella loescheii DSM 19665 = JCM 12249 = ATCC 15930]|uniref:DUF4465 domain-containing protein n=2 Tax=Hoylesella loescheii TaxID=840 RepID=A0A069QLH0_HOYLO|nr:hypothetical protein HMPREF1991_00301 [Hoylesella loescheii DSM 19665 = JCM 12249 = ATCC 15930]
MNTQTPCTKKLKDSITNKLINSITHKLINSQNMKKALLLVVTLALTAAKVTAQQFFKQGKLSQYIYKVVDYSPAPGQFVNTMPAYEEGDNAAKMALKCTESLANNKRVLITLGAFGGSVTFHFDHSVANIANKKDFIIEGNAFQNSSEPGIVMVSKDVNRNGIADDPWYELRGSVDDETPNRMVYGYEVTYTSAPMQDIPWTDNKGGSGKVERNKYHAQEYYPLWMPSKITYKGSLLPKNATQNPATTFWELREFAYGYVDNKPNTDKDANSFDIDWAVDVNRKKVKLDFIDFVKVYSAEQQMAGWLGETSTEVAGAEDLHLEESVAAINKALEGKVATFDDVDVVLNSDGYYIGASSPDREAKTSLYTSGNYRFAVTNIPKWNSWNDFSISNRTATNFKELFPDQFNSCVGHGCDNSANYCVAYFYGKSAPIEVLGKPEGDVVRGLYVTNSAYTLSCILNGDNMSKGATGKDEFEKGDWLLLTIWGTKADGSETKAEVYLADYRSSNSAEHYYLGNWQWVDLSGLGAVKELRFSITGSRNNKYGLTTPSYVCVDNINGTNDGKSGKVYHTTGIDNLPTTDTDNREVARYTVDGKRINAPVKGINIVKYADGTTRKVVVK